MTGAAPLGRELGKRDLPARASERLVAAAEWGAFDLDELPPFPERELLPADGTLLFFAALESLWEPTEAGNHAGGALRVWYVAPGAPMRSATRPRPTRRATPRPPRCRASRSLGAPG